jgi:hypothetical protein
MLFLLALLVPLVAFAGQNMGKETLFIYGGDRGKVPFPHRVHQEKLSDCSACHDVFPQEEGSIEALKAEGKLRKKKVMNAQCIKCHRTTKKKGGKSGPVKCKECHVRT